MDDRRSGKDKRHLRPYLVQKTGAQHIADLYAICCVPVLQAKTSLLMLKQRRIGSLLNKDNNTG
ncbi:MULTISPECIES: hypothetical protein [Phocaeicola]|uniref:hypothetical protein n=1 Tax=Phocaeicola TaxID=909656 RepID=UPI001F3957F2|nr:MULTISPECIES: hypothetical protein [Phocaeicola]MCE9379168.1 hypothetical protein [Phocaeicola vulgatus]